MTVCFIFQLWLVNYRLDFMDSIKIYFSFETCFRLVQCGFTQPLKASLFLYGWQPTWLIYTTKFIGDVMAAYTSIGPDMAKNGGYWLNKEVICSVPVHLDLSTSFGIATFIVMCNSAR